MAIMYNVTREIDGGLETLTAELPVVITTDLDLTSQDMHLFQI